MISTNAVMSVAVMLVDRVTVVGAIVGAKGTRSGYCDRLVRAGTARGCR